MKILKIMIILIQIINLFICFKSPEQQNELNQKSDRAAIIGGGDGGVARECVSKGFGLIDWYELDPEVVEVCNKHLGEISKKSNVRHVRYDRLIRNLIRFANIGYCMWTECGLNEFTNCM